MTWPDWPELWGLPRWWPGRSFVPATMPVKWCLPMRTPILLPDLGAEPVRLSLWYAHVGELVFEGDRLVEVLANGATFDVAAPATGKLAERLAWPRELLTPGQILGTVEIEIEHA